MRWEIYPNTDIFDDCFDSIIAALAEYYGYDSMLLKLGCYSFKFIESDYLNKKNFHSKVTRGVSIRKTAIEMLCMEKELVQYHKDTMHDNIISELEKHPVIVEVDPFYCKWADFYQKNHWMHNFIICDVNIEEKIYYCTDIYYPTLNKITLSFEELEELCNELFIIHFNKKDALNIHDIRTYLKRYLDMSVVEAREQESKMLQVFGKELRVEDIGNPLYLNASILLTRLSWIAIDKRLFSEGLKYIENKFFTKNIFEEVYEPLALVEKKVIVLKNTLIKYSVSNRIRYNAIESLVQEIAQLNVCVLEALQQALSNTEVLGECF